MLSTLKTLLLTTSLMLTATVTASEQNTTDNAQHVVIADGVDVVPACASFPHCWPTRTGE
ncbi:hypothetical protein [Pseudoalteromonas viridis]|uniref:Uncharacterized protein n=1 Tax=Pseudoalteromonas viridis TaxID=339617 RepID=A0ABX7V7K4_9GAMM|nr:hypothetical protein [Pseudoalteromonas viridis]QTL36480.1 hypothetical protein J5X90_05380 [Pseudoalteromonas viridis]